MERKFIEFTAYYNDKVILVNPDYIQYVWNDDDGCANIVMLDSTLSIKESYDYVTSKLAFVSGISRK